MAINECFITVGRCNQLSHGADALHDTTSFHILPEFEIVPMANTVPYAWPPNLFMINGQLDRS